MGGGGMVGVAQKLRVYAALPEDLSSGSPGPMPRVSQWSVLPQAPVLRRTYTRSHIHMVKDKKH